MALNLVPTHQKDRALIFIRTFLNTTDAVTKVTDHSVLDAIAQGIAKVAGKAEKDVALALSTLYPDNTYGTNLDTCADTFGIAPRFGASQSSTYVRLVGNVGTVYDSATNIFTSKDGIQFVLENNATIGNHGFTYAKVRSIDIGSKCNVLAGSINDVNPKPTGHKYIINEYRANGGRDIEDDDTFRHRIKDGSNIGATHTIAMLEQVFMKINNNVLRLFAQGINDQSQIRIAIVTQNGIDLSQSELDDILLQGDAFFGLSQLKPYGKQTFGLVLKNIEWQPIDMSFRVELYSNYNVDEVRAEIQLRISKYLDHKIWIPGAQKVEWDNLLEIVKNTPGVKYVPDNYFFPNNDVHTDKNKLPRLRGFLMLDTNGALISGITNQFNPIYYPQLVDFSFQQTALSSI